MSREWKSARPLVVIDPGSREQVERLRDLMDAAWNEQNSDHGFVLIGQGKGQRGNAMQAALREFANPTPPKPAEPQGLGAVIEDVKGDLWVLINVTGPDLKPLRQWRTSWGNRPWSDIGAVRMLSEGVTS